MDQVMVKRYVIFLSTLIATSCLHLLHGQVVPEVVDTVNDPIRRTQLGVEKVPGIPTWMLETENYKAIGRLELFKETSIRFSDEYMTPYRINQLRTMAGEKKANLPTLTDEFWLKQRPNHDLELRLGINPDSWLLGPPRTPWLGFGDGRP